MALDDSTGTGTAGDGGNGTDQGGNGSGEFDATKAVERLSKRYGGIEGALKQLVSDNYGYREEIRSLKDRVPKDGSVVLEGDSVKHWNSYRELGAPSDLKKMSEELGATKGQVATLLKAQVVGKAAKLHGLEESVLSTLAKDVELDIVEKVAEGKATHIAVVKHDGDKTTPLEEYAKTQWAAFLPALKPAATTRALGTPAGAGPGAEPPPQAKGAKGGFWKRSPL